VAISFKLYIYKHANLIATFSNFRTFHLVELNLQQLLAGKVGGATGGLNQQWQWPLVVGKHLPKWPQCPNEGATKKIKSVIFKIIQRIGLQICWTLKCQQLI